MKNILLQIILLTITISSYSQVPRFFGNEDLKPFKEGKLYGFKNLKGEIVVPCIYDYVRDFSDGLAAVESNGKYGYINKEGKIVAPIKYDYANSFSEGLARVGKRINGEMMFGHINIEGQIVTPLKYEKLGDFHEGFAYVGKQNMFGIGSRFGFVNKFGEEVVHYKYHSYIEAEEGYATYPPVFSEGLAVVKKGSRWAYINHQGETIIKFDKKMQPVYDFGHSVTNLFSDGVVWAVDNFKYNILDKNGNVLSSLPMLLSVENLKLDIRPSTRFISGYAELFTWRESLYILVNKSAEVVAIYDSDFNLLEKYQTPETQLIFAKWLYDNYCDPYGISGLEYHDRRINASYKYFKKLSEFGNSYAQYVVGFMTQYGQGTEANEQEAIKWYKKSNEPEAKKQLAMLERKEKNQEPIKKEEPILLADTKTQNNKGETITQLTPVESKTVVAETSHDEVFAQNTSQVHEQSKQLAKAEKKEKRIALLIGNAKYNPKHGLKPLNCPENDVDDLKSALKKLGFTSVVRTNLNQLEMRDEIHNFCDTIKKYDVALFYYSGHAIQDREGIKILPVDEEFSKPGDKTNSVEFNYVLDELIESEVKTKILILDACRSRAIYKGIDARWTTPSNHGCFVAFATRAGEDAVDGDKIYERNSVYTKALLESLNLEGDLDYIFNDVENKVYMRTKNSDTEQLPEHKNELRPRNFYLHK